MARLFIILFAVAWSSACGVRGTHTLKEPESQAAQARELYEHGLLFARAGDLTRAEQYLALALREGHDPDRTLRVLLSVCVRASRLRSALLYATPHLTAHPQDWSLRQFVASVELALGDHRSAKRDLYEVIAHKPDAAEAHFLLAIVLSRTDEHSREARVHFERYLALLPRGVHADEARAALSAAAQSEEKTDDFTS